MRVKRRLQINIAVSVLMALLIALVLFMLLYRVSRTMEELEISGDIISGIFERVVFRDDYLRTDSERAKIQWLSKHEQIGKLLLLAREKFAAPEDEKNLDEMVKGHEITGRLVSAIIKNREGAKVGAVPAALSRETENRLLSQLNMRLYDTGFHARMLRDSVRMRLFADVRRGGWGIIVLIAILATGTILNSSIIGRAIVNRIGLLAAGASVIGGGNLEHRIGIKGDDEFAELSKTFDAMTVKLQATDLAMRNEIGERKRAEQALHKSNRTLSALGNSREAVIRAEDETSFMNDVCKIIVDDCGFQMVWIGFAENDEAKSVRPVAHAGFEEGYLETLQITWADTERGRGPTGTAIRTGKIAACRDMLTDPAFMPWREEALRRGYASSIVFPLRADDTVFGAITIYSKEADPFSEEEVKLLAELVDDLAYGIMTLRVRTARIVAETALRESEQRLALATSATQIGMFDWNLIKGRLLWTKTHEAIFGYAPTTTTTEHDYRKWADRVHPEDLPLVEEESRRCMQDRKPFGMQYRIIWPDGSVHWVETRGVFLGNNDGKPERMLGVVMDITERKGAEEALRVQAEELQAANALLKDSRLAALNLMDDTIIARQQAEEANDELRREVLERKRAEENIKTLNAELNRNVAGLADANKELEAFSYSVSHDLRAPLRTMMGFSDLLLQKYLTKLDDKGKRYLEWVINGAAKMNQIIDDLLHLSRISRHELHRQEVDFSVIAASVATELCGPRPGCRESIDIKQGIAAYADPGLIKVALSNLLGNALKFTSKTVNPCIEFGTFDRDGKTVYYVKDNGAGFDQSSAERMFLPFHRMHTEQEFEGTGIGLAIVERVIRHHGGKIWAEGKTNEGAAFFFTL